MAESSSSIGFGGLLTIVFITLKLTGVIDWSWIWVLCPLWIGFGVWLAIVVAAILIAAAVHNSERQLRSHIDRLR